MPTLFVLNPHAAGGRARRIFQSVEGRVAALFPDFVTAITETPLDVEKHLDAAIAAGVRQVIAVGGDGTNHVVLNALARRAQSDIVFGCLPVGTGQDWARLLGIPRDPAQAVEWLSRARSTPCDLGQVVYSDPDQAGARVSRLFLNIASAGASGEVAVRVNQARRRTPVTFLRASILTLLYHPAQPVAITCDGRVFYEGKSHLVVAANGQYFGRGMWPAPQASMQDGLFDVLVLEGVGRLRLMRLLQLVYSAGHLGQPDVHFTRAAQVQIATPGGALAMEFDGEPAHGQEIHYTVLPAAIAILRAA